MLNEILDLLLFTIIISSHNHQGNAGNTDVLSSQLFSVLPKSTIATHNEICWTGTVNGKTPVFIHYQLDSNLIVGEITYLKTKNKIPIRLLGKIENKNNFRLMEFDSAGNITGIIQGKPTDKEFAGTWASPKSKKEFKILLNRTDTSIISPQIRPDKSRIFGAYHYQYGDKGYNGDITIVKIDERKIAFNILSLTNVERGPNIAEVEKDTIALVGNNFVYKIPESDSCEFKVTFYKDFVNIDYTRGYCNDQFGLNATVDGIFIKIK